MLKTFRTYQLAQQLYKDSQGLKLQAPLRDQFERARLSIVLNLAEGCGKLTLPDRRKFYSISLGSLREVEHLLELSGHHEFLPAVDRLGAHIYRLIQSPGGQ